MPMRHNQVIYLVSRQTAYDEIGNAVKSTQERRIFANAMSVGMQEFYQAGQSGIRPERQFEIYSFEYRGEDTLRHNGDTLRIVRTTGNGDKLRLICERSTGHD